MSLLMYIKRKYNNYEKQGSFLIYFLSAVLL